MCICTPNIRTPYCGNPGCERPGTRVNPFMIWKPEWIPANGQLNPRGKVLVAYWVFGALDNYLYQDTGYYRLGSVIDDGLKAGWYLWSDNTPLNVHAWMMLPGLPDVPENATPERNNG